MMRLRGHHLFCTTLFQGCGYDEAFTARMKETLAALEAGTPFTLCQGSDVLCEACPHRTEEGCDLSTEDVLRRDKAALQAVDLAPGTELSFAQAGERLKKLKEEQWLSVCGGCRWQKEGLCSWKLFQEYMQKRFG